MSYFHRPLHTVPVPPGLLVELKAKQEELRSRVRIVDDFDGLPAEEIEFVAGVDCGFENDGSIALAGIVVLRCSDGSVVEAKRARVDVTFPYVPGYLSFRELPAIEKAWRELGTRPQLVFVDGLGIAHPRRLGIASHLGVTLDVPSIGVAKAILVGEHAPLPPEEDSVVPLFHRGEDIGRVLRSKVRCNPLIVSPGHRVTHETALAFVRRFLRGYRLPEPTRLADRITNARYRDAFEETAREVGREAFQSGPHPNPRPTI